MPQRGGRRQGAGRKKAYKRSKWNRRSRMRLKKPLALKPHTFVERLASDTITVANEASAAGLFKTFNFNQIPQNASYRDLFEYYTINKIVVEFRYKSIGQIATNGAVSTISVQNEVNPVLYFKIDHNDNNSDPLATMKESSKTREHQLSNSRPNFTIQLKPAVQSEAYKSTVATTYIPKWGQQLNVLDGTIPHYGLKAYCVGYSDSNASPGQLEVTYKMYFTMRNNE